MKKILISLALIFSLLLSSCMPAIVGGGDNADVSDNTSTPGGSNDSADINDPCPGYPDSDENTTDKPSGDGNNTDKPSGDENNTDKPSGDENNTDKPSGDGNNTDKPSGDGNNTDTPSGDGNNTENPDGDIDDGDEDDGSGEGPIIPWEPNITHIDDDDNGYCDRCEISVIVEVNFFVINDFHGKMSDSDTQPGVDELSLYLKNLKSTYKNPILLSSGDMWQGGAESNLTRGLLVTEWMNELDFAAMTLGNHEFDWGEEYVEANANAAEFPLLAINIYDSYTNQLVDYVSPSVMVDLGSVQIGVIGAIGDCYSSISSDMVEDIYFKTGTTLTALVKAEANKLRSEGADYIVYSIHDGQENSGSGSASNSSLSAYYDTSLSSGGYVDVVFEGHSHQSYVLYDNWGVYHLQGGGDNKGFVHFTAEINAANGNDSTKKASVITSGTYQNLDTDPYVAELFEKYADQIAKAYEVLGYNPSYIGSKTLKQLVANLYCELGVNTWGDKYNIVLGGGYLSTRSPYNLYSGQVTYADLMMLFPFDNDIVLCSISGYNLKKKFINTTNSNYYIGYSEYGNSIKNKIQDNATYYIIVDSYTSQYAPNKLTEVARYTPGVYARDLLADYIRKGKLF